MEVAGTPTDSGSFSHKVIAIAAGEAHTLALTGDGSVHTWGRGMFGRLGTGSQTDELSPVRINFELPQNSQGVKIVGIAAGAYHSLALADDGSVWSWGYNVYGQLGFDGQDSLVPHLVNGFVELNSLSSSLDGSETKNIESLKISSLKAGGMMSLAIDDLGGLWVWGNCPHISSSDGKSIFISSYIPLPVRDFHGQTVVKVACGSEHIVALVSTGETHKGGDLMCYSWGNNHKGQLGLGDKETRVSPKIIETFNSESPWAVYDVACGAFHTALLAYKKSTSGKSESLCWTFGLGDSGQLGHGTTQSALIPKPVEELPKYIFLISIDCGLFHTSLVSSAGDVWSWGMEKGLGLCPDATFTKTDPGDAISPRPVLCNERYGPKFPEPVQIACGAAHTILVAAGGYKLWSWGRGQSGVLGDGKTIDCIDPSAVLWPPLTNETTEDLKGNADGDEKSAIKDHKEVTEDKKGLKAAMEEMKMLQTKLSIMETYASVLHGSIFGKPFREEDIPISLQNTGTFDIAKEWENMLESSDHGKLVRLEMFYRHMLADVKDKLMTKRIKEIVKECLDSSATRREF